MFYRILVWFINKMIMRERVKQIYYHGYSLKHDDEHVDADPDHLIREAREHYNWGHPIIALALLEAQKEYEQRQAARRRPDVRNVTGGQ